MLQTATYLFLHFRIKHFLHEGINVKCVPVIQISVLLRFLVLLFQKKKRNMLFFLKFHPAQ